MKCPIATVMFYAVCALGQTVTAAPGSTAAMERRIAQLRQEFAESQKLTAAEQARIVAAMHAAIDQYVYTAVSPNGFDRKALQERLRRAPGVTTDGGPYAFTVESANGRQLVIAYTLQKGAAMGAGAISTTMRAYASREGRFALAAGTADNDMDGYGSLNVTELNSPVTGELWLLVWGQMTGANGPNVRMRIYAWDGTVFRPVWMPENAWGTFTVRVTERGFTVSGPYYRESRIRHDDYRLAPDGVYRQVP